MILWPWPMIFYAELAGVTAFIVNGLQFQKWVNAEFFMQTPLLKEKNIYILWVYSLCLFCFLLFGFRVGFFCLFVYFW